jgi:hypothetical protein
MPKHPRSFSVEIKSVEQAGIVIEYRSKEYYLVGGNGYVNAFTDLELECAVIHTPEHRAMLTIDNIRSGIRILRHEINPLKYKEYMDWVCDE